jgi:acetoin utilization deacetylase AcuC-like enzyme
MTIVTDPKCGEYRTVGHPEKPARVLRTVDLLKTQKALDLRWSTPAPVTQDQLLRAHTPEHLARLETSESFDPDTPWHPGISEHARRSVGGSLSALSLALEGEASFSLFRPPGHHATKRTAMGFCYLGSMAVAALEARSRGLRVGILDFDVHHGNGTEDIVLGVEGVTFASIHQCPCYPGTGETHRPPNCFNFPFTPGIAPRLWRELFLRAMDQVMKTDPQIIGISAGFDAFIRDPLANGTLEKSDFHWIGSQIGSLKRPVFSILEGGYSLDLPDLILAYLLGMSGVPA